MSDKKSKESSSLSEVPGLSSVGTSLKRRVMSKMKGARCCLSGFIQAVFRNSLGKRRRVSGCIDNVQVMNHDNPKLSSHSYSLRMLTNI